MSAADISDLCTGLQLCTGTIECRDPAVDEVRRVTRAEETIGCTETAIRLLVPRPTLAGLEGFDSFGMGFVLRDDSLEKALHACRLTLSCEDQSLFRRKGKTLIHLIVSYISRCRVST